MKKKIRVAILFGGKSAEHEVSLQSAKSIIEAIDKDKYDPVLIGIDKRGRWLLSDSSQYLLYADDPKLIRLNNSNKDLAVLPGRGTQLIAAHNARDNVSPSRVGQIQIGEGGSKKIVGQDLGGTGEIDVVFPVLHGTFGEDGTMQGLLKIIDVAFVGPGVLGSAVGMDKDVMKRLLRDAGIPVSKFITYTNKKDVKFEEIKKQFGVPFFVKPANMGSSVGVNKVHNIKELAHAVSEAFAYDNKILVEEFIDGREIECSVLGNEDPIASVPGEILPQHEFYSYEAKYIDEKGATLKIPATLPNPLVKKVREIAVKTFKTLCCEGMGRVDMFLTKDGKVFVNEINTIPGFTKISMYPKLWEATGIGYAELIDRLITLAIERHERDKKLKTSFT